VQLSWTASADEEGGSGLYAYVIQRWEGGRLSSEVMIGAPRTTFSDTSHLISSTTVTYAVIAVDHAGNHSSASNSETVTIPPCSLSSSPVEGDFGGELEVFVEDYPASNSRTRYVLKTGKQRLLLQFAGNPPEHLKSGTDVHVHGVLEDGALKVKSGDTDIEILAMGSSTTSTTSTTNTTTSSVNNFGQQKTLVMLVNFQDKVVQPWTFDQVGTVFGTVSNFFLENSYQQTWLNTTLAGWYTVPVSSTTCDQLSIASYAKSAATAAGVNLSAYAHYVYVFPTISCQWVGTSTVGGNPSEAWINNELRLDVVAHEMGHNLGLHHSHSWVCNDTGDTSGTTSGPNCFSLEYGDGVDIMGWSHEGAHYNAFMKEFLGWLNKGVSPPITTVQTSGTYVLDPYELIGSNPKALKILKGIDAVTGKKVWYYVEYRQVAGFDSYLADAGSLVMDAGNILNGVLIHTGSPDESSNTSFLLDMTPDTYQLYAHDPALDVGLSFSDSAAGVTITPQWVNSTSAGLKVSFGQSSCVHANPAVTVSPSSQSGQAGSVLSYSVSVTNKDSAGCGGSTFGLQANVPSGWTAAFASSGLTLSPGASGSTTLTVTSSATATAGSYNIGVTAASGSYAAGATVTDSIASPSSSSSLVTTLTTDKSTYAAGDTVTISDATTSSGQPVANASVAITITKPNGVKVSQSGMTSSSGTVTTKLKLNRQKDPAGIYQVVATVTSGGVSAQASKSFTVQ
jgi:hypothetical protein